MGRRRPNNGWYDKDNAGQPGIWDANYDAAISDAERLRVTSQVARFGEFSKDEITRRRAARLTVTDRRLAA